MHWNAINKQVTKAPTQLFALYMVVKLKPGDDLAFDKFQGQLKRAWIAHLCK
jgi:hypothetical protein